MENPEINNYASLSIVSEASINGYNNTVQLAPKESIKTCANFNHYLICLIHFRNEYYIDGPTYTVRRFCEESWRIIERYRFYAVRCHNTSHPFEITNNSKRIANITWT